MFESSIGYTRIYKFGFDGDLDLADHRRKAGGDQFDSSDADSVSSVSTGLSELTLGNETEYVNSQEFELEKYIDALFEKRYLYILSFIKSSMVNNFLDFLPFFSYPSFFFYFFFLTAVGISFP